MKIDTVYDLLVDYEIATADEINLVTTINGYTVEVLEDILFARTGLRTFEQFLEENNYV